MVNYSQLILVCCYRETRIAFIGDATERHLGTQRPKKKENLREITDMALPVTTAAKSIFIKHHHVALGVDMRAQNYKLSYKAAASHIFSFKSDSVIKTMSLKAIPTH